MVFEVMVETLSTQFGYTFTVTAPTIPEAFTLIPQKAADAGYGLLNDGQSAIYKVRVLR